MSRTRSPQVPLRSAGRSFGTGILTSGTSGIPAKSQTRVAPPSSGGGGRVTNNSSSGGGGGDDDGGYGGGYGGGGGGYGGGGGGYSSANHAAKDQSEKQNKATQDIINALLKSLSGYESGRKTSIENANTTLNKSLEGILQSLLLATQDYDDAADVNEQDQAAKSAANMTNRARERVSLLQQAASQGAGETDQLRAQIAAFLNSDQNQQEVDRAFADTQRSINTQIAGANSQAETSRRSAWNQNQEAVGNAWNEFWKNTADTWTNIQRTAAGNTNTDSDSSVAFTPKWLDGKELSSDAQIAGVSANTGKAYSAQTKDGSFFKQGRREGRDRRTTSSEQAGMTRIKAPKAAEGATLRGRW